MLLPRSAYAPEWRKSGAEKIEQYQWIMRPSRVYAADCVMAETKKDAVAAFDGLVETWG
jgi:hypothetical protein